jgi:hypothetical protein
LRARRAFGWPAATPAPRVEPEACVRHFALDAQKWAEVCVRSSTFYGRTAFTRYDPSARLEVKEQYLQASQDLFAGRPVRDRSNPSIVIAESLVRAMRQPSTPAGP